MLKKIIMITLLSTVLAADKEEAKALFNETNCLKCHGVNTFKPREHKVNNFLKLHKVIGQCANGNSVGWFEEEIEDVASYLNDEYYHFKKK